MEPFEPNDLGQGSSGPTDASPRRLPAPTPGPRAVYPENSQAGLSLVFSLIGLIFPILSPIGWYFAQKEITGIDSGRRDPSNRGNATAGKVLGIIGTIWLVITIIGVVLIVAIFVSANAGA